VRVEVDRMRRILTALLVLLAGTGVYLYALPAPTLAYGAAVLAHVVAGLVATVLLALAARAFKSQSWPARVGWTVLGLAALTGLALIKTGGTLPFQPLVKLHIALSVVGLVILVAAWTGGRRHAAGERIVGQGVSPARRVSPARFAGAFVILALIAASVGYGAWYVREVRWHQSRRIANPAMPPMTMTREGLGAKGPFFPSSIRTPDGKKINSSFFMDSQACERCHGDIYKQWYSSAHHFSSFNNQWYRKSIEYMQDVIGPKPSKWCGGCHDPALMFSGMMDRPIKEKLKTPEAQAGLGCVACHAIVEVDSTMGQGGYTMEYPKLSDLAASEQPVMRFLHDFLVKVNPEPHRRAFLKPFMKDQSADFCSTCHKVHLDVPVNNYRWIRGFNDYDNWQASGVSGMGARSFYYPAKSSRCVDCHMPKVQSNDFGNKHGLVSSHRFPAANVALPFVNGDKAQLEAVTHFLKDKQLTVDIFAIGPSLGASDAGTMLPGGELSTTFAVGEEGGMEGALPRGGASRQATPITAPLNRVDAAVRRGDTSRVDVVVRTRKVGHFFPGGTVDAFDVWLELKAVDDKGQTIFWSGQVEDDGKGPVEKGAHFYRSLQVDANANPINKRNAWATRAAVYVRLIPPGAADTVHFRLKVPETTGDRITLTAKLNYRKFSWYNTQFSYAGVPDPDVPAGFSADFDDRPFVFTASLDGVSGKLKAIPDLPITVLAEDTVNLRVLPRAAPAPAPKHVMSAEEWTRWNDYGIGLLLQGDLKGAEAAFLRVTEAAPKNPDGWVNIGRVRVQEGNVAGAREVLEKALTLAPDLARANYFFSRVLKAEGDLEGSAKYLRKVIAQYPRDRVVRNDLGRVLFLMRRYKEAVEQLETALTIDPEDLTAHYNLMLAYNGLGQHDRAKEHQQRYLRFKADESSQAITGPYRLKHPHDNNERQAIHEHESVALGAPKTVPTPTGARLTKNNRAQTPGTRVPASPAGN
jgi:Flp pilus assembly protein TadD